MFTDEDIENLELDSKDVKICNRYIKKDMTFTHGNVCFESCIIDGNIKINNSDNVQFFQCIVMGEIACSDIRNFAMMECNVKCLKIINSNMERFKITYTKIYHLCFESIVVHNSLIYRNMVYIPYFVDLLFDKNNKFEAEQILTTRINKRAVFDAKIYNSIPEKDVDSFYLNMMLDTPIDKMTKDEILFHTVDFMLKYCNFDGNQRDEAYLKYKKILHSNSGLKKIFVAITGGYYIPSRWIIYLCILTVIFAMLYSCIPSIQFLEYGTNNLSRITLLSAVKYSICQIIGSNPTQYISTGISELLTTIQNALSTVLVGNCFAAFVKKYFKE